MKLVLDILEEKLDIIKTYYIHKISISEKYPCIDFVSMLTIIDDIKNCQSEVKTKLLDSQIEISFLRACRHNKIKTIKSSMCRS